MGWYSPQIQDENDVQQTVEFHNLLAPEKTILDHSQEEIALEESETSVSLQDFFSRPVPIYSRTWLETDSVGALDSFLPWHLYFNTATVKYKLNNWAFLRCNLHLRFTYNASPFYYGATMASYQPLPDFNPVFIQSSASAYHLIPYSQMKGRVMMFPQTPEDQEIVLPFFHPASFLRCQLASDFTSMGKIWLNILAPLQSANGVTGTGITLKVYAWATDVIMSGPSIGLALQDGDEYGMGPVSKPASAIANVAAKLGDVPVIGRFATATQIGATAISSIAKLFGFTNVPVIEDQHGVQPRALPPMASTDIGFPVEKLTVDPKNELTIDHRSVGLGPLDELPISHLVQKESWLTQFDWTTAQASDALLYTLAVTPQLYRSSAISNYYMYMTPMCWLSTMFQYWHGDVIFRFKIICSKYHRGRVRITFDPDGYSAENIATDSASANVTMTKIVDISETTDVEFRVPYQQYRSWLACRLATALTMSSEPFGPTTFRHDRGYTNGSITIRVHNILTAPTDTSTVSVQVFVRGAENLEFAGPTSAGIETLTPATIQDGEINPHSDGAVVLHSRPSAPVDHLYLTYMGERVASLRVLLRRMCHVQTFAPAVESTSAYIHRQIVLNRQPISLGYDTNLIDTVKGVIDTATTYKFSYTSGNFLCHVSPAFIGNRGSVNWSIVNDSGDSGTRPEHTVVLRDTGASAISRTTNAMNSVNDSTNNKFWWFYPKTTGSGAIVCNTRVSGAVNFQMPFYSPYKFCPTDNACKIKSTNRAFVASDYFDYEAIHGNANTVTATNTKYFMYAGAGTDYDLLYFLCVPTFGVITSSLVPV